MRRFGIQTWLGCAALLLGVSVVRGQTDSPQLKSPEFEKTYFTHGLVNGNLWQHMDEDAKPFYIRGFKEGTRMANSNWQTSSRPTPSQKELNNQEELYDGRGFSLGEMSTLVNHFYTDDTNRRIPIALALMYVFRKIQGASNEELNAIVLALRQQYK